MEAWSRMFPSRSGLASRHCFAVRPNSATFNRSASLAYVRAACAAVLGQTDGACAFDPLSRREHKAVQAGLTSKPLEFEGFEFGIVDVFPDTQKLDRIPVPQPILQNVVGPARIFKPCDVGNADVVIAFAGQESD